MRAVGRRAPTALLGLAFAPAPALAVAAGTLGLTTPLGIGCAIGALGWAAVDLALVEPRLRAARGSAEDVASAFLRRALRAGSVDDVARDLGIALRQAIAPDGPPRALLIAPGAESEVRTIPIIGPPPLVRDPGAALDWLGLIGEPLDREGVAGLGEAPEEEGGGAGARATLALMDACSCDVVMPLRHRGLLLGVVLVSRPHDRARDGELVRLLRALRAYATAAVARTFLHAEVRQRSRLTRTVDLATAMQEAMMPVERPIRRAGYELRGLFRPVEECGGDLWMWRDLGAGKVLLLTADATGHGAAPALLAAVAKGTVDALCQLWGADVDPAELLAQLGRVVYRAGRRRYLMTAFAAVVDVGTGTLSFANAGQNFPYVVHPPRAEGEPATLESVVARGDALGAAPRVRFTGGRRDLAPGDRLILYTDGVVDAGQPGRDAFGDKRLCNLLVELAGERSTRIPELVLAALERHTAGLPMGDDVTMLVFELGQPPEGE
jgi:serine phosphatase RsbU (regulator of sigma subunit)